MLLSADARTAVAEYVELERPGDADGPAAALFLSPASIASRWPGGRLSPRAVNSIGVWRLGHQDPSIWEHPLLAGAAGWPG